MLKKVSVMEEKIIIAYPDHCIEKPGAKYKKKKEEMSKISSHTHQASNDGIF